MARFAWLVGGLALLIGLDVYAAKDAYVVLRSGEKVKGFALSASADGTLKLKLGNSGPVQTFKRGTYKYGFIAKPKEVKRLENAFDSGKYDTILKAAASIFEKYKYLGWGDHISYLEGMAQVERKKYADAKRTFERGQRYPARHTEELTKGFVKALIGLKEIAKAKPILAKMMKAADNETAAFAFNVRGMVLTQEGKQKEAVLEYLKTLLLFEPSEAGRERAEAKKQALALLKGMNDARWKDIEKIK